MHSEYSTIRLNVYWCLSHISPAWSVKTRREAVNALKQHTWHNQTHWGYIHTVWFTDQSGYMLCGFCPLQCCVGDAVSGALEEARGRAGLQMGHPGHPRWIPGGAQATVQGEGGLLVMFLHAWTWKQCLLQVHKNIPSLWYLSRLDLNIQSGGDETAQQPRYVSHFYYHLFKLQHQTCWEAV